MTAPFSNHVYTRPVVRPVPRPPADPPAAVSTW
jgi:hypothetical protein